MTDILTKSDYKIKTERLLLSLIEPEDANQLFPYMSNPEISKDMSWKSHKAINDTTGFIESVQAGFLSGKSITWCIKRKSNIKKIIGIFSIISITRKHRELTYDKAELAYWVAPDFQKKGFMREAGKAVIVFGFEKLRLHKLFVAHHINNENSKRLILKLNFKPTYVEQQAFMKNEGWIDVAHYELLRTDYQKRQYE